MRSHRPILLAALVALTRAEYLLPSFDADLSAAVTADGTFAGVPSSCNGHFNTACGNSIVSDIVEKVSDALITATTSADVQVVLNNITNDGAFNMQTNFWPFVIRDSDGIYVASGRINDAAGGLDGSTLVGQTAAAVALSEGGVAQPGILSYMHAAANSDGYFEYVGFDNYHNKQNGVRRIGLLKRVSLASTLGYDVLVASAFSDVPLEDTTTEQDCSADYSDLCSFAYTKRMSGEVVSALLRARTQGALEQAFASINNQNFNKATGFYPFVYTHAGGCVAHGKDATYVGQHFSAIVASKPALAGVVDPYHLVETFKNTSLQGGGFVGYDWVESASASTAASLKNSYITGVKRFGVSYYIGVGFKHQRRPIQSGPACGLCSADYNYPCARSTLLSMVGHAQSLISMENRFSDDAVLFQLMMPGTEYNSGYFQADGSPGFYPILARMDSSMMVAHPLNSNSPIPPMRILPPGATIIGMASFNNGILQARTCPTCSFPGWSGPVLHADIKRVATAGGGWVRYPWWSATRGHFDKLAYAVQVNRGGVAYYVFMGMSDNDWGISAGGSGGGSGGAAPTAECDRCAAAWDPSCPEHCAISVTGGMLADLFSAKTFAELQTKRSAVHLSPASLPAQSAFATRLLSRTTVLADPDASLIGKSTSAWYNAHNLPSNILDGADPMGGWLGPYPMTINGTTADHLLYHAAVEVGDTLADGTLDGEYDTYHLLVAVPTGEAHFVKPKYANHTNATTGEWYVGEMLGCDQSVACLSSDGTPLADGAACAEPLLGRPGLCQCVTDFAPSFELVAEASGSACSSSSGVEQALRKTYSMSCVKDAMVEALEQSAREKADLNNILQILAYTLGPLAGLVLLFMVWKAFFFVRRAIELRRKEQMRKIGRCRLAIKAAVTMNSSAYLLSYENFKTAGKLMVHEEARDSGLIETIDNYEDLVTFATSKPVVFFSHQWLALETPDPDGIQYRAMLEAAVTLCEQNGHSPKDLYIFLDIVSIPQKNMRARTCAIETLGCFASIFEYFVIIAPPAVHRHTGKVCNMESYGRRGWCRLEQWGHMCMYGDKNMFYFNGDTNKLEALSDLARGDSDWFKDSIMVFEGDYTQPEKRGELVDTVLGLYAMVINAVNQPNNKAGIMLHKLIEANHERVFPPEFFEDLPALLHEIVTAEKSSKHSAASDDDLHSLKVLRRAGDSLIARVGKSPPQVSPFKPKRRSREARLSAETTVSETPSQLEITTLK